MTKACSISLVLLAAGAVLVVGDTTTKNNDDKNGNFEDIMSVRRLVSSPNNHSNNDNKHLRYLKTPKEEYAAGPDGCIFSVPKNRGAVIGTIDVGNNQGDEDQDSPSFRFDSMVVFGDSLSDIGTRKFFPPCNQPSSVTKVYCNNPRTSDGPLLVDYVAAYFHVAPLAVGFPGVAGAPTPVGGSNYARSGAVARNSLGATDTAPHFSDQILNYQVAAGLVPSPVPGFTANLEAPTQRRLHVVWFGSNDVQDAVVTYVKNALSASTPPAITPAQLLGAGFLGIQAQLTALLAMPNVCNVLVVGPIDASLVPSLVLLDPVYKALVNVDILTTTRRYCQDFNDQLESLIATAYAAPFQAKCTSGYKNTNNNHGFGIKFVHTVNLMDAAFPNYPVEDRSRSCNTRFRTSATTCLSTAGPPSFLPIRLDNSDGICTNPVAPNLGLKCDCRGYLFYDEIHLSGEFHQAFFEKVLVESLLQNE
ncbi:hypothetical protein ACA910_010887 [Epithemia clementina (nom. ined.)]